MQALRGHHDIMMDWSRRSFERSYLNVLRSLVMHNADISLGVISRFDSVGHHD